MDFQRYNIKEKQKEKGRKKKKELLKNKQTNKQTEIIYRTLIRKYVLRTTHSMLMIHCKHPHPNPKANLVNLLK